MNESDMKQIDLEKMEQFSIYETEMQPRTTILLASSPTLSSAGVQFLFFDVLLFPSTFADTSFNKAFTRSLISAVL